jgi:hypothetical protein
MGSAAGSGQQWNPWAFWVDEEQNGSSGWEEVIQDESLNLQGEGGSSQ